MTTEIMPDINEAATLSQIERHDKIIELAKSALANAADTKAKGRLSVEQAIECGRLLIEEKLRLKDAGKRTKWSDYFSTVYSEYLPIRTATGWMKLASKGGNASIQNTVRAGMLALEIFPAKIHAKPDENVKNGELPIFTNAASVVNKFAAWRLKFGERVKAGSLTDEQANMLRIQFQPIIDFLAQLQNGTLPEMQAK